MTQSLHLQTLALIGQEFLATALANGGSLDSALAGMLQSSALSSGREKTASALTGGIRADAASMRQGARNASEGSAMAAMVKEAALSAGTALEDMAALLQTAAAKPGGPDAADQAAFDNMASALSATVSGAAYNGISLIDKDGWADERLAVAGDAASLSIQLGASASTFTLRDLSALKDFTGMDLAAEYALDPSLAGLTTKISEHIATLDTMASGYEALAGAYAAQAGYLESQAGILTATAARAIAGSATAGEGSVSESTMKNILIDLLLRDQGTVIDTSS